MPYPTEDNIANLYTCIKTLKYQWMSKLKSELKNLTRSSASHVTFYVSYS